MKRIRAAPRDGAKDAMPEPGDAQRKLKEADEAAAAGDLVSADRLLRDAARMQEAALGPVHPDLANTYNNLAVVAERTGRLDDAESFYRRATAIASASLPVDHPMVVDSRQNLVEFCRAHGLRIDQPTPVKPAESTAVPQPSAVPSAVPDRPRTNPARATLTPPPPPSRPSRAFPWVAAAVVVLAAASFVMTRRSPSRNTPTVASPAAPEVAAPAPQPLAAPVAPPDSPPAAIESRSADPAVPVAPRVPAPSSEQVSVVTAELCQTLSTGNAEWRCDPIGDTVARGPIVFYTRVKTPRAAEIVHLWYQGNAQAQSTTMKVGANLGEGYRTYSRRSVDVGGDWRVELRTAGGELLFERRFSVQ